MAETVIIHFVNDDPILAETEALPGPTATSITVTNPRRRDGKPLQSVTEGSTAYIFAMHRISFIEVMATTERATSVVELFRE